jgi:DNA-directed RNA polymerase specialized sigma24 family protein
LAENSLVVAVTRAQQGDMRAFDGLVRHFQNAAVAYARTLLRDPAAAEDAAQEAFVQAWQDLPRLTEAAAFGAWLRRIVFKYCDRTRRSARFVLPLSDALPAPREEEPAVVLEKSDQLARVRMSCKATIL